jgi:hypothetical protein
LADGTYPEGVLLGGQGFTLRLNGLIWQRLADVADGQGTSLQPLLYRIRKVVVTVGTSGDALMRKQFEFSATASAALPVLLAMSWCAMRLTDERRTGCGLWRNAC